MIDRDVALDLARLWIAGHIDAAAEATVDEASTREDELGWVVVYDGRRWLEDGDSERRLIGNSALLVERTGAVHVLPTAYEVEHSLEELRRYRALGTAAGPPARDLLLRTHQGLDEARRDASDEERAAALWLVQERLRADYRAAVPSVPVGRCPRTGELVHHSLDTDGLDGLWWHAEDPCRPSEALPSAFVVLTGALRLGGDPERTPFAVRPGPGVPFVLPRLLEVDGVQAVVSSIPVGRHTAFPVAYFGGPLPEGLRRPTTWGVAPDTDAPEERDFELAGWIERGKLLWTAPDDDELELRGVVAGCPFLDLEGERHPQLVLDGSVSVAP